MKIILFRSNNIFDSRVNKYRNFYERKGLDYTIVGWDKKGEGWRKDKYEFFQYKAKEGVGGFKAITNHFKWMWYVFIYLKKHRNVTTIHACDLNTAFPAALFKCLYKRDVVLIFDACDWFSAEFVKNILLNALLVAMEKFAYKWADELIICEPERKEQIPFLLKKEPLVMRNIPEIDMEQVVDEQDKYKFENNNPTLAYLGGFDDGRFLLELLTLVETEPVNLLIAGSGNEIIMNKCQELNSRENVKYFGRVKMEEGLNMENAADVVYAMYCKIKPNHIYAAPNKYYEALLLGKPLITTKGTIVGNKVEHYGTGWAVEEDIEEMKFVLNHLNHKEIEVKGKRAFKLWNEEFKNDLSNFFENIYSKTIK